MKNNKKLIIATVAIITAVVGVGVAIATYLKRKADAISDKLDYDGDLYFDDDDYYDDDITEPDKASDKDVEESLDEDIIEDDSTLDKI